ncbi:MAG: hypothetical protein ABIE22_04325 [archaeon]
MIKKAGWLLTGFLFIFLAGNMTGFTLLDDTLNYYETYQTGFLIGAGVFILVIILLIILVVFKRKKKPSRYALMLTSSISALREMGYDDSEVQEALIRKKWPQEIIDEAFKILE